MALIKCIECGKEISDRAEACVHCGCPIEKKKDAKEIDFVRNQLKNNDDNIEAATMDVVNKYGMDYPYAKLFVSQVSNGEENIKVPKYIVKTIIVGNTSRKKMGSALGRAAIGGALLGPVGLLAGTTAKTKETTTFQIIYSDGTQETTTVKNNDPQFERLCSFLD